MNMNVALATAVPIAVAAILLMLARFFDNKQLEQAGKTELVFAGSTVFLVLALVALVPLVCSLTTEVGNDILRSATGNQNIQYQDTIDMTLGVIKPHLECMVTAMGTLYYASTFFEMSSTTYIEVFMSEVSSGFIYKMFTERIINTANMLTFYSYIYYLMVHILNFVKATALTLFLPLGILLRAFPPTRGAGAYVLAFALGIYFVFPLSYIMMNLIPYQYTSSAGCGFSSMSEEEVPNSANALDPNRVKESESWVQRKLDFMSGFLDETAGYLKQLTIVMCLTPVMAMTITLSFVLSSTSLFGGNIPEVGRGLVKLI
jgi:hypothetical protein